MFYQVIKVTFKDGIMSYKQVILLDCIYYRKVGNSDKAAHQAIANISPVEK